MKEERAYDGHGGVNIKRSVSVYGCEREDEPVEESYPWYDYGTNYPYNQETRTRTVHPIKPNTEYRMGLLVGVDEGNIRLRYPNPSTSGISYLTDATTDLKSLAALFVCGLVEGDILADKIEEDYPVHAEAAHILREYSRINREKEQSGGTL